MRTKQHTGIAHSELASEAKPHVTHEVDHFVSHQPTCATMSTNDPDLVHRLREKVGIEKKSQSQTRRELPYSRTTYPIGPQAFVQGSSTPTNLLPGMHTIFPSSEAPVNNSWFTFGC